MKENWDLSVFYRGFDDPAFDADLSSLPEQIEAARRAIGEENGDEAGKLRSLISRLEDINAKAERLQLMISLTLACDAENEAANAAMTPLMRAMMAYRQLGNAFSRYASTVDHLDTLIDGDEVLRANGFFLRRSAQAARHMLPGAIEEPVLRMQLSGGEMFLQLRDKLDATLEIDFRGEKLPLSAVRALAYDADAATRREAYEAELAAYARIELPMSYCLNAIKAEARTMADLRGYDSVLAMTLDDSNMRAETLEAMWSAIREALPELREYLKAKGRLLGHDNGLPFYDLFAPLGGGRTYTAGEARALLLDVFGRFSPEMADMMREAFDEGWIDLYPRAGKSGGAFCAGCYAQRISRVMTNFTGSLSDVSTLAHELGHAFNNRMLERVPVLMTSTPMPLAETASTFNETVLAAELRRHASAGEELALLDASLTENIQTMVDIYSRFLFEQKVVDSQADHAMSVRELKDAMLWAQEQSYGDGLDPNARHPYMWACKSHYYSTEAHFYNFPYAFGNLFARGLYARYRQEGEAFVPRYGELLSRFGSDTIENVAAGAGIDVTQPAFWRDAVESVLEEVRRFVQLADRH